MVLRFLSKGQGMKNKLRAFFFVAAPFLVISASSPTFATVVPVPSDSINIDNGQFVIDEYVGGQYVVHNNSSNWYIYGFAVSNPNASTDNPQAFYYSWVGVYANLSITGPNTEPVNVYYSNYIDLSKGLDHDPGLLNGYLLSEFIAPNSTTPFGSFTFTGPPASDVGLLAVDGSGDFAQFSSSATPLPSTWLMLIAGFVGFGFLAYRGTKKSSAALAAA